MKYLLFTPIYNNGRPIQRWKSPVKKLRGEKVSVEYCARQNEQIRSEGQFLQKMDLTFSFE